MNINSGTLNFAGVRQVGDVLRAQFDTLGFTTRWVDGAAFQRAGHLVAEHPGPGQKILLIGHLDTVFEPSNPFQKFQRLNDSTARGPGVIDMKGGDVILLFALRALKDAGMLDKMNVTVVFNGDEEEAGTPVEAARKTLIDAAKGASAALGFEDGAGDPKTAVVSRRSAGSWTLRTTGTPAHSGQIFKPEVGAGAVYEASRILHEFYTRLSNEQYLTFNPGFAVGGTLVKVDTTGVEGSGAGKRNVVAEHMEVTGDLRTLSPEQHAKAKKTMLDDRVASSAEDVRRRSRSTTAIRRWRRPRATSACWRCTTARVATSAPAVSSRSIRRAPARPTSRSSRTSFR